MKTTILAIGKKHDPLLEKAVAGYSSRLSHYCKFNWQLVDAKITPSMSEQEIRDAESSVLLRSVEIEDTMVLLDERGSQLTSVQLANKLQGYMNQSVEQVTFVIGGAFGVNKALTQRANLILSLSSLVFPHQLVRLIIVEQLYRTHTILAGEKYHHK